MKHAITVIGSGFGGLAAACRLAMQGHQVSVFEKNAQAGGNAVGFNIEGISFDTAPTILRMPHLIKDVFSQAPDSIRSRLILNPQDIHYRFYQAQTAPSFEICADIRCTIEKMEGLSIVDSLRYKEYLSQCQRFYEEGLRIRPQIEFTGLMKMLHHFNLNSINTGSLGQSLYQFNGKYFSNPILQSSFSFYPLFFGQNPLTMPAQTAMIHAIEQKWGIAYPQGGMRGLITLLCDYFQFLGGKLFLNAPVSKILADNGRIHGLRLGDGSFIQTDYVVSNLSPYQTANLLKKQNFKPSIFRSFGSSYLIFHFVTHKIPQRDKLVLHSVINPQNFQQTIQSIFRKRRIPDSPWFYFHIPSLHDESFLTTDMDAVMVVCPIPNLLSISRPETYIHQVRQNILKTMERVIPGFRKLILHEKMTTPTHLLDHFNMDLGTNYQPAQTSKMDRLFYVGGSTWRGLGLIGALSSAEDVASTIANL